MSTEIYRHLVLLLIMGMVLVGCKPEDKPAGILNSLNYLDASDTVSISRWQRISEAARKTRQKHNSIKSGRAISEDKWEKDIRELKPIRVYTDHGGNVIIVLRESIDIEEGLYARLSRSSHYPQHSDEYKILDKVYTPEPSQGIRYDSVWKYQKKKEEPTEIENLVSQIGTERLSKAAQETLRRHAKATKAPQRDIDSEFWTDEIRRFIPVRLYKHRGNIVVVLCESNDVEEGVYIYSWISSYFPRNGDDGFTLKNLGDSVFKYTRDLESEVMVK